MLRYTVVRSVTQCVVFWGVTLVWWVDTVIPKEHAACIFRATVSKDEKWLGRISREQCLRECSIVVRRDKRKETAIFRTTTNGW